jgi:thiamine-phosphate pyrophosphorylase
MSAHRILYYITDRTQLADDEFSRSRRMLEKIAEAARSRVDFVQLREKDLSARALEKLAVDAVKAIAQASPDPNEFRTKLLINSRSDVAIAVGAAGVHLRSNDISAAEARAIARAAQVSNSRSASDKFLVSASCHTPDEVARAASDSADFAVFAPVFEKRDVPGAILTGVDALRAASRYSIPVLALGGVTLENARLCFEAGVAGIAGIRLFQENSISEVVRKLNP